MQPRTKRQKEVLDFIKYHIEKHGYEPSYQQIARNLGVSSKAGIAKHIKALESQGLLARVRENGAFRLKVDPSRSLTELVCEIDWLEVPKNDDEISDWETKPLFIPKLLLAYNTPEAVRAFRVMDDAMIDLHIHEGDIALIKMRSYARDGDIVVALVEDKRAFLTQFFRTGANIELRPANERFDPLIMPADKIEIKGIYRGLLRPLA